MPIGLCDVMLTDRPEGSPLVGLHSLDEANAMFLGRGLYSTGVEGLVGEVDILKPVDVGLSSLDARVGPLLGGHVACFFSIHLDPMDRDEGEGDLNSTMWEDPSFCIEYYVDTTFRLDVTQDQMGKGEQLVLALAWENAPMRVAA